MLYMNHVPYALPLILLAGAAPAALGSAKVFPVKTDARTIASLKRRVAYVMSLSEGDMLAIVPRQSGIYFTDCPNCEKGTQDFGPFKWSPREPHSIVCKGCGAKYPNNPDYPDDKVLEVRGPDGPHRYPYYERPSDKYRIFFRAHADYWAREYMADQCQYLAELYWITKDDRYARRAALILVRFAEVYPGYAYHMDLPFRQKRFSPWNKNRVKGAGQYRTAKWSWWAYMAVPLELVRAYDCLKDWPGLATMAGGRAKDKIENDLLAAMVDFGLGFREPYSNMSPVLWRSVIYAGRVLGRREYVAAAVRRFNRFTAERFLHDGHWMETAPSYCAQVYGLLKVVSAALKGYEPPADAAQRVAIDPKEVAARIDDVARSLDAPRLPNGRLLPVNDTWSRNRRRPRERMEPALMPGLGAAVMGGGEGDRQLHVYLDFTAGRGHKHKDALSFGLFAFGEELFRDIGYTHTKYRAWACSTPSHNTVVVDGRDSGLDRGHTGNRLRAYATDGKGFHVADAESLTAYAGATSLYRRTLFTIGDDAADCYVVDVFQVSGGKQHDYLLHGSADRDSTAEVAGAALKPFAGTLLNPGVELKPPRGESSGVGKEGAYGFVHDLRSGAAGDVVSLTMRLKGDDAIGTRTVLMCEPDTTVYLGQAPSIRRAKEIDAALDKYQAPFFCARRKGKDLKSVFVAVHEPFRGRSKIKRASVERLRGGLIVTIDRGRLGVDRVCLALDEAATLEGAGVSFAGRYGMVRMAGGRVTEAHLVGATRLQCGDFELKGHAAWTGQIQSITRGRSKGSRGSFDVAERIPAGDAAGARALIVRHADGTEHAYTLVRVEALDTGSRLHVLEDPAMKVTRDDKTQWLACPQRTINGATNTYELLNAVHVTRGAQ